MRPPAPTTDTGFPCTGCGACCRIGPRLTPGWPLNAAGTACAWLGPDDRCRDYAHRPAACRVTVPPGSSVAAHYEASAAACNALQRLDGIDPAFRVDAGRSPIVRIARALSPR